MKERNKLHLLHFRKKVMVLFRRRGWGVIGSTVVTTDSKKGD
jgi:hypothetical protein